MRDDLTALTEYLYQCFLADPENAINERETAFDVYREAWLLDMTASGCCVRSSAGLWQIVPEQRFSSRRGCSGSNATIGHGLKPASSVLWKCTRQRGMIMELAGLLATSECSASYRAAMRLP